MSRSPASIASFGILSALAVAVVGASQKSIAPLPTHAVRGVVKSVSTFYVVVITGSGRKVREMTFLLGPSTEKDGEISIGVTVSVRYRQEGRTFVSTAISAQPQKPYGQTPRR